MASTYYVILTDFMAGGDAALTDEITADGQNGVSFMHPMGEIFLLPLAGETDSTHHIIMIRRQR